MNPSVSNWIPQKRIRVAVGCAVALATVGLIGSLWSPAMLTVLAPALAFGWAAFLMLQIRHQLSSAGGGWEARIHALVISKLALAPDSREAMLDIGCGGGSLIIALLDHAPAMTTTGVDFWGENWDYAQSACESRVSGHGHHATFRRMDAARLEFADESFDVVVSVMCFHEVRATAGAATRGPLVAVSEALRVLRPGGAFVFVDRFADKADYGPPSELAGILQWEADLRSEPLVETLGVPWPLNTKRALGPVEILWGRKRAMQ